ncbi:tryptophan synthase beta subunit-like PLP-dependent enzyme [Aaosphaeria arxii CBS 175.79]|uniref:Tryptophan synthase beta subunit-like PLP-dependent enzyme n=1 Tax=Aaosphaeria arxii CBS 175.79 TaxID=1450172 RepID=A0A6A5XUB5_9PLEO|nr:tryptophan synthase beta subunit-like PLP-dependent enzyme [Aaosphaeria arxii CBS 175.79]KAF2015834.1 tryptophan synthase beta subunit-like PLP-dependent enzyme [Aaosphaeria arxii CBS 175.79]
MATIGVRLPRPFADIPRVALMYPYPTPIEPLNNLTRHLSQQSKESGTKETPKIWIKHEDSNSALAYGGNKVRKLEYVIADAVAKSSTHLVTVGGVQSNSQRQVAAAGNRYGMRTILTPDASLGNPSKSDRAAYHVAGNVQIASLLNAEWRPSTEKDAQEARDTGGLSYDIAAQREMEKVRAEGGMPYYIPSGASLHLLGGLGFARWAFELEQQEKELGVRWDAIVVSCASGSTLGGMVAGFKLIEKERKASYDGAASKKRRVIGIQATSCDISETERVVNISARNTARLIGLQEDDIKSEDYELIGEYNGGAYGLLDDATRDAIKLLAETEGILTDPVYTGKAISGVIGLTRKNGFDGVENVLFVHTGGTPALSAYPSMQ